jgi:hypothetical protein
MLLVRQLARRAASGSSARPLLQLHRMCSPREFPYAVSEHWCAVAPQPIAAALPCRFTLR